jgi:phospholipid/cholesterol/gamma-HCH transport system ATP-binding protein
LTSRPRILLYDEPTTGLDPITALTIDAEIVKLRDLEHVSSIIVTHQLRDAFYVATHQAMSTNGRVQFGPAGPDQSARTVFLMLKNGKIAFEGPVDDLRHSTDEYLQAFLS